MHYVRLYRAPAITQERGKTSVSVSLAVTTDLGDTFLTANVPIKLKVGVYETTVESDAGKVQPADVTNFKIIDWMPGARIVKTTIDLPAATAKKSAALRLFAFPTTQYWGGSTWDIVSSLGADNARGRIIPVWADVHQPHLDTPHVSVRRLRLGNEDSTGYLEVEEEIGESIARHIWDGGATASCVLIEKAISNSGGRDLTSRLNEILTSDRPVNVLELGCGVGIFGLAIATVLLRTPGPQASVLLTDLATGEERTLANIKRLKESATYTRAERQPEVSFASLDWEEGSRDVFGSEVKSKQWDLVVLSDCIYNADILPVLIGTLSALHEANKSRSASFKTYVLLAQKPRHSSESALFKLMDQAGWSIAAQQKWPLPVIGKAAQRVEMYLFEK